MNLLRNFSAVESYAVYFLILVGCGVGLPFNSDIVMLTAGVLSANWILKVPVLIPLAVLGLICGDSINFWVARRYGQTILCKKPFSLVLSPEKIKAGEAFLKRKGSGFLFFVRFLPLIRTVLYFTAGTLQIPPKKFYFLDITSTILYVSLVISGGHFAAEHADALWLGIKKFQFVFLGFLVVAVTIVFLKTRLKEPAP